MINSRQSLLQYGLIALPIAFAGLPIYIHAPEYYASEYGISLTALGIVLLIARLFDAIQDPLIGYLSDRLHRQRLTIMAVGSILLITGFVALFVPIIDNNRMILWFFAALTIATLGYSILSINLASLGATLSNCRHENTRIAAYRERFGLIGLLCATLIPSLLLLRYEPKVAFAITALLLAGLMIISFTFFFRWYSTRSTPVDYANQNCANQNDAALSADGIKIKHFFKSLLSAFLTLPIESKKLYQIYALSTFASGLPAVLILFFINDRLQLSHYTGLFLALYFISSGISMTFWQSISKKIGKANAWSISMLLAVCSFMWAFTLSSGDLLAYLCICLFSGFAFGAELILPASMLADQTQAESISAAPQQSRLPKKQTHLYQKDVTFRFSLLTLLMKLTLAICAGTALPILDLWGYHPGSSNSEQALQALSLTYAVVPSLIKVLAAFILWQHRGLFSQHHRIIAQHII